MSGRRVGAAAVACTFVAALLAGCAGSSSPGTTPATTTPTTVSVSAAPSGSAPSGSAPSAPGPSGPLSLAEAVAAGDAACERFNRELPPQPTAPSDFEPYLRRAMAIYRQEQEELQAIASRTTEGSDLLALAGLLAVYVELVESNIPTLAQDPQQLSDPSTPYGRTLNDLTTKAKALGFRVCGKQG